MTGQNTVMAVNCMTEKNHHSQNINARTLSTDQKQQTIGIEREIEHRETCGSDATI